MKFPCSVFAVILVYIDRINKKISIDEEILYSYETDEKYDVESVDCICNLFI